MALFVLAIGVTFVVTGLAVLPGALEQRRWPQLTASVDRPDVYARSSTGARPGTSGSTRYVVRLYLAYQHEGRRYVSPMDAASFRNRQQAERTAASVAKGEPRTIRVDSRRPNRIDAIDSWPIALPATFLGAGLLVSWIAWLPLRR